jgi:hypothetical protein
MATDTNLYKYEDDNAQIHSIRLAAASIAAAPGGSATGALTGIPVEGRRSSRSQTLQVRGVRLVRRVGTAPNDKAFTTFLVIPTLAGYDGIAVQDAITVGGVAYTVQRKLPEMNTGYSL